MSNRKYGIKQKKNQLTGQSTRFQPKPLAWAIALALLAGNFANQAFATTSTVEFDGLCSGTIVSDTTLISIKDGYSGYSPTNSQETDVKGKKWYVYSLGIPVLNPDGSFYVDPAKYDKDTYGIKVGDTLYPFSRFTCVSGTVWNDSNGNNIHDAGEPPLPGISLETHFSRFYPSPTSVYKGVVTDANGKYTFAVLFPEVFDMWPALFLPDGKAASRCLVLPSPHVPTPPDLQNLDVCVKLPKNKITGLVWRDYNGDGMREYSSYYLQRGGYCVPVNRNSSRLMSLNVYDMAGVAEPYITGTVNCVNGSTVEVTAPITNGVYTLELPDEVTTCSIEVAGYLKPTWNYGNIPVYTKPTNPQLFVNYNIGLYSDTGTVKESTAPFSISGMVWEDANADGCFTQAEKPIGQGLEWWGVFVKNPIYGEIGEWTVKGDYKFVNLFAPGAYTTYLGVEKGWVQTYPISPAYYDLKPPYRDVGTGGINFGVTKGKTLKITKAGGGTGEVKLESQFTNCHSKMTTNVANCGAACENAYLTGSKVTLTTTSAADSYFAGWTTTVGTCSGTTSPFEVIMGTDQTVTAKFEKLIPKQASFKIGHFYVKNNLKTVCGSGSGSVSLPANCQLDKSGTHPNGYSVDVKAHNSPGGGYSNGNSISQISGQWRLSSNVQVCAKKLWGGGAWYEGIHTIYGMCKK